MYLVAKVAKNVNVNIWWVLPDPKKNAVYVFHDGVGARGRMEEPNTIPLEWFREICSPWIFVPQMSKRYYVDLYLPIF